MLFRLSPCVLTIAVLACGSFLRAESADVVPLQRAHAHNDYAHTRPLLDALDHGFCSVEADIFQVKDNLLVGHTYFELKPTRTLEGLYLEPLAQRIKANGGAVHPDTKRFVLLIDFKTKAETTYPLLRKLLEKYASILSRWENGRWTPGAVTVVLSGSRPSESLLQEESVRYVGIDGRTGDLDSNLSVDLMPMISDAWGSQFKWRGVGPMPEEERTKLKTICEKAHAKGRIVRFWATPDMESVWRELQAGGVDLLNTDNLPGLRDYLLQNP